MPKRLLLLLSPAVVLLPCLGCMLFCPAPSPHRTSQFGRVQFRDYATCRRLRVDGQQVARDPEKRLAVTVRWRNRSTETYRARICVRFLDREGRPERGAYTWDLHRFPPGQSTCRWVSYTMDAAMYRIEVRSAD